METLQAGVEKLPGLCRIAKSTADQEMGHQKRNLQLVGQNLDLISLGGVNIPLEPQG